MRNTELLTSFEEFVGLEVEAHSTEHKYTSVRLINKLHDKDIYKKRQTSLFSTDSKQSKM
jgi:hypothetical protein